MKEVHALKLSINRAWQSMNFDLTGKFKMNVAYYANSTTRLPALVGSLRWEEAPSTKTNNNVGYRGVFVLLPSSCAPPY